MQKKEAKHLKYTLKKEKCQSAETQINSQQVKKSCVNDIRSMMIVKEKTPIREEDDNYQSDYNYQSDDTIIIDSGTESDTNKIIIASLGERNSNSNIKDDECAIRDIECATETVGDSEITKEVEESEETVSKRLSAREEIESHRPDGKG